MISVCFIMTEGPNIFFLPVNWVEGQRFPFFQRMTLESFCAKPDNLSLEYLRVQTFGCPNNANSYASPTEMGGCGHANR